ncbi:MAG TPA: hemerythrin domain-containing protein [Terriglobia bacterium]|nr:hemerythrin domain-containing protein [Terriglobia bacterium]
MPKKATKQTAFTLLKADHDKVKKLFDKFEKETESSKRDIAVEAIQELKIHAAIEEQVFYPALRHEMDDEEGLMDEADEEHHVAKFLIAELEQMQGDEDNWDAKFMVLAENVRHHIKEEEREIFPKAKTTDIDFVALGEHLVEAKDRMMLAGPPVGAEETMVGQFGLRGDSPSKMAQQNFEPPLKVA